MPIGDGPDGYPKEHFDNVYKNIIIPSCKLANFKPIRADETKETNIIHVDILKKLVNTPLVICDLSSRNPNVLFELGIRQAFDKPVVLIQDSETPRIFDVSVLRCISYSKEMKYHEVLEIQQEIKNSIEKTMAADGKKDSMNSIVNFLGSGPAQISDIDNIDDSKKTNDTITLNYLRGLQDDMRNMHMMIRPLVHNMRRERDERRRRQMWREMAMGRSKTGDEPSTTEEDE